MRYSAAETREQAQGGTCTWAIRISTGEYVYDPTTHSTGFSIERAHAWLSELTARQFADSQPWCGASARAVRARP